MSSYGEPSLDSDESFGPGTDLVVSLLAVLLLLLFLVVREQREAPKQLLEIREGYNEEPLFEKDKAGLTPRAMEQLRQKVPDFLAALESDCCNQLLVEGHASPEAPSALDIKGREQWNLKLSIERSMAVVDYLYHLGFPYECMSVAGFGRSHSVTLTSWLGADPSRSIDRWDETGRAIVEEVGESTLAAERVVKIFGIRHESSLCDIALQRHQITIFRTPDISRKMTSKPTSNPLRE